VTTDRVARFRELHAAGCFVMPNAWDRGSARLLEQLGFPAVATTSSGLAWSLGRTDYQVSLEEVLEHLRAMAAAVDVPVNADFEGAFAVDPEGVAENVRLAAATGVAGLSVEDSTGDPTAPLHPFALSLERVRAAREAIDAGGSGVLLTARTEGFVAGLPDLDEAVRRLRAYAGAGADCVYAPGITTAEQIRTVVEAVAPTPVNLLVHRPFTTVSQAAGLGVRRISTGGALAKTAWRGFLETAREIAGQGSFTALEGLPDLDGLLGR
jgi:2-methylisocitrate lyase-like PEP mutase family enzyme